jgi:hypothetical protein
MNVHINSIHAAKAPKLTTDDVDNAIQKGCEVQAILKVAEISAADLADQTDKPHNDCAGAISQVLELAQAKLADVLTTLELLAMKSRSPS